MDAKSFPMLVMKLAEIHHDGNLLEMSQKTRIPQSSLWRWTHGLAQVPRLDLLEKLCRRYHLRLPAVWNLVSRDVTRVVTGRDVPLPDMSDRKPGPKPKLAAGVRRRR